MSVRDLVGDFYGRLWNERDLAIASAILHPNVCFRGSVGSAVEGRSAVCSYVEMVTTALSEYRCDVQTLVVEGEQAAAKVVFSGQHVGEFLGYAPAGARVEWLGSAFFTANSGLLTDIWVLGDVVSLRAQLEGSPRRSGSGVGLGPEADAGSIGG